MFFYTIVKCGVEFAWVCVVLAPKRSSRSYEILGWLRKGGFELVLAQV